MNYSFSFMAFVDGGSGCRRKKIKTPSARETSVLLPAAEQERGKSRATGPCHCFLTVQLFTACPRLLSPARYLFLDRFFVENVCAICASVWSCFSSSCVWGKHNQREKSMYPEAMKKSIAFIRAIFSAAWCRDSKFCLAAIYEKDQFFIFIYSSFIIS